ncbi:MAG: glycosyltransferase family 2 protein [Eubacteriales bacterium]|nr:glycosyltransferase family 2 protein [Eubacteriales bacterium]
MRGMISIIVSVYNEEQGLRAFYTETTKWLAQLSEPYGIWFVNDGSTDKSSEVLSELLEQDREHVRVITFSRNFGHEAAMTAGLDYADGDILIFMDADLQHPPALIPEIVMKMQEGYDVISMVRTRNETAGLIKNITSGAFYRLINHMSDIHLEPAASDFFAIDRKAAMVLRKNYRETVRFLRGYVQNIGFRKTTIDYEAAPRTAGESHYSLRKLWRFSMDTIICFSNLPLKLGIYAGLFSALLGVLLIIYTLFTRGGAPSGYATIIIVLCFMFAMLFVVVGVIGEYISVIFNELKDRPIYIISDIEGTAHEEET